MEKKSFPGFQPVIVWSFDHLITPHLGSIQMGLHRRNRPEQGGRGHVYLRSLE
jgi:hypothetical protein